MSPNRSSPTSQRARRAAPVPVCVAQRAGASRDELLDTVLDRAGFWQLIAQRKGPLVIKPDLDCYEAAPQAGTEPALVERLIDLLHDRGRSDVVVGEARNEADDWLHNRDPMMVPHLVGYRFVTAKGRAYEVVDLRAGDTIHDRWRNAAVRINFAKNRTHEDCHYALCVHNLAGLVSSHAPIEERCLRVLQEAPPHFNLIDAIVSAHGGAGHRAPRPIATHTLIASRNALLADWAGAARMGLAIPWTVDQLLAGIHELLKSEPKGTQYVRPIAFRGGPELWVTGAEGRPVDVSIFTVRTDNHRDLDKPINCQISEIERISSRSIPGQVKVSGAYVNSFHARKTAEKAGFDDALMFDREGHLAEASAANVFLIEGGRLLTPRLKPDVFPGITRLVVIKLAADLGIDVRETEIGHDDVAGVDGAFLCSTLMEIRALSNLGVRQLITKDANEFKSIVRAFRLLTHQ